MLLPTCIQGWTARGGGVDALGKGQFLWCGRAPQHTCHACFHISRTPTNLRAVLSQPTTHGVHVACPCVLSVFSPSWHRTFPIPHPHSRPHFHPLPQPNPPSPAASPPPPPSPLPPIPPAPPPSPLASPPSCSSLLPPNPPPTPTPHPPPLPRL